MPKRCVKLAVSGSSPVSLVESSVAVSVLVWVSVEESLASATSLVVSAVLPDWQADRSVSVEASENARRMG